MSTPHQPSPDQPSHQPSPHQPSPPPTDNPYRQIPLGGLLDPTAPPHDDETLRELCRCINWSREHRGPVNEGVMAMLLQHAMRELRSRGLDPWSWCDGRETGVPPVLRD